MGKIKTKLLAGMLSAVMLLGTAAATGAPAAAAKTVSLSRLGDSIVAYPLLSEELGDDHVVELTKDRTVKGEMMVAENETLYIPAGKTLTLNKGIYVYGTVYIESGGELRTKGSLFVYDGGSVVIDGKLTATRDANLHVRDGALFYASPTSELRLLSPYIYSGVINSTACLGKVTAAKGLSAESRNAYFPSVVGAVRTTADVTGALYSSGTLSAEEAIKALSAGWYTLSELPTGGLSEYVTVLFSNGCSMKFAFLGGKILSICGSSVRNIWYLYDSRYGDGDDFLGKADPVDGEPSGVGLSAVTIDRLTASSTNVVRAELVSIEENKDSADHWFKAVEQLKGETPAKFCVSLDLDEAGELTQEFREGTEYLLFLKAVDNVYMDARYILTDSVILPVENGKLSKAAVCGRVTAVADEVSAMKQIRARVKADKALDVSQPVGGGYIHSTDIDYIVKASPYIARVKLTGESEAYRMSDELSLFRAEVLQSYKLPVGEDGVTQVVLTNGSVKAGGEYIVLMYNDGRLTSKKSLFSADDAVILEALRNAGLM